MTIENVADPAPDATGDTLEIEQPGGYDQVPTGVWLGPSACSDGAVVAYLCIRRIGMLQQRRPRKRGNGGIERTQMKADMGVSIRTVDARINDLIEHGWLLVTPRIGSDGAQTSNRYQLLWDPITSEADPRLVAHLAAVEAFNALMEERQARNVESGRNTRNGTRAVRSGAWKPPAAKPQVKRGRRKLRGGPTSDDATAPPEQNPARGGGAENCAGGPEQNPARGGEQNPAPQNTHTPVHTKDPSGPSTDSSLREESAASSSDARDTTEAPPNVPSPAPPEPDEDGQTVLIDLTTRTPRRGKSGRARDPLNVQAEAITREVWDTFTSPPGANYLPVRARVKAALQIGRHPEWVKRGLWLVLSQGIAVTDATLQRGMEDAFHRPGRGGTGHWLPSEAYEAARPIVEGWLQARAQAVGHRPGPGQQRPGQAEVIARLNDDYARALGAGS